MSSNVKHLYNRIVDIKCYSMSTINKLDFKYRIKQFLDAVKCISNLCPMEEDEWIRLYDNVEKEINSKNSLSFYADNARKNINTLPVNLQSMINRYLMI